MNMFLVWLLSTVIGSLIFIAVLKYAESLGNDIKDNKQNNSWWFFIWWS